MISEDSHLSMQKIFSEISSVEKIHSNHSGMMMTTLETLVTLVDLGDPNSKVKESRRDRIPSEPLDLMMMTLEVSEVSVASETSATVTAVATEVSPGKIHLLPSVEVALVALVILADLEEEVPSSNSQAFHQGVLDLNQLRLRLTLKTAKRSQELRRLLLMAEVRSRLLLLKK